jgi:hypothetical protein
VFLSGVRIHKIHSSTLVYYAENVRSVMVKNLEPSMSKHLRYLSKMLDVRYIQSSVWHLNCVLLLSHEIWLPYPRSWVEQQSYLFLVSGSTPWYMKKETHFPTSYTNAVTFWMWLLFFRSVWPLSLLSCQPFLFSICFFCWFSNVKVNVTENPTLKAEFFFQYYHYLYLPRCMSESCKH